MVSLFGANYKADSVQAAIDRAYRDFCRTIRIDKEFNNKVVLKDDKTKKESTELIKDFILQKDNKDFDARHRSLCEKLNTEKGYTIGQVQKWVNMTMKYLMVLGIVMDDKIVEKLHIPIDSIIIERALDKKLLRIETLGENFSWSRIDNYDKYISIQNEIRENLSTKNNINKPIIWEFQAWNDSTVKEK